MAGDGVLELTKSNFDQEVIKSDQPVLVDFWADWCVPCRILAPVVDELAKEFAGKVKVGKIDLTDNNSPNTELAIQYEVNAIPTVIVFKKGQIARKFVGLAPKKELVAELQKAMV